MAANATATATAAAEPGPDADADADADVDADADADADAPVTPTSHTIPASREVLAEDVIQHAAWRGAAAAIGLLRHLRRTRPLPFLLLCDEA